MLPYCLKCGENTANKTSNVARTNNGRMMLLSKWTVCDSKKSKFIKEQEDSILFRSSLIRTPLSKIPSVGPLLF